MSGPLVVRVLGPGQQFNVDVSCALGNVYYYVLLGLSLWPKQKAKLDQASQYKAHNIWLRNIRSMTNTVSNQAGKEGRGKDREKCSILQKHIFWSQVKKLCWSQAI